VPDTFYRIKDWSARYETNETRKLKSLSWVRLNNKMDGLAFRLLAKRPDAANLFCAWVLMLELASKSSPRGELKHNNLPLSPGEMGEITGFPGEIFESALSFLSDAKIGWIEQISASPGASGENPGALGKYPETPPLKEGKEAKEGNGREAHTPNQFIPGLDAKAKEVMDAYPRFAKDGRQVQGFTLHTQSQVIAAMRRAPEFPWLEAATLEKRNDYPTDFGKWLAMMPDPVWLEAKRSAVPPPQTQTGGRKKLKELL
jgi:hypothetical protein